MASKAVAGPPAIYAEFKVFNTHTFSRAFWFLESYKSFWKRDPESFIFSVDEHLVLRVEWLILPWFEVMQIFTKTDKKIHDD